MASVAAKATAMPTVAAIAVQALHLLETMNTDPF